MVADDLYDHDSLTKIQKKLTRKGLDTNDVPAAIKQLTEDWRIAARAAKTTRQSEDLDKNYDRDLADLQNLRDLQASQLQFANALKAAQP